MKGRIKTAHGRYPSENERVKRVRRYETLWVPSKGRHVRCTERWQKPRGQPDCNHPPSHNHLRRSNTDMESRNPFSRLKKKVKHRLSGGKDKPERTEADAAGERADQAGSLLRSEPHPSIDRTGADQRDSYLRPDVEAAQEGDDTSGEKVEQAHPSPPAHLIPPGAEPDGM